MSTDTSDTETPDGGPAPPRRRMERAKAGRMLAGVCEGLGRYFDIDPVIFRIGFVVATLAGGAGVIAYGVAWLALPEEGARRAPIHLGRHTTTWVPWILVGLGFLALVDGFDHRGFPFGWGVIALVVAGWLIWSRDQRGDHRAPPAAPAHAHPPTHSRSDVDSGAENASLLEDRDADTLERAPRSILGRLTLSVLLVGAGVALALAQASDDVTGLDVEAALGAGLLIVGAALVAGAWWGRARALVAVGVLLAVGAAGASVVDVPLRGGVGERTWSPVADVRPAYRLGIGDAELDLTRTDVADITTAVSVGIGHVRVIVPRDATVEVDAHTGLGELIVLGRSSDGTDLDESIRSRGSELGPTVDLDVRLGVGQLEVIRDPS